MASAQPSVATAAKVRPGGGREDDGSMGQSACGPTQIPCMILTCLWSKVCSRLARSGTDKVQPKGARDGTSTAPARELGCHMQLRRRQRTDTASRCTRDGLTSFDKAYRGGGPSLCASQLLRPSPPFSPLRQLTHRTCVL